MQLVRFGTKLSSYATVFAQHVWSTGFDHQYHKRKKKSLKMNTPVTETVCKNLISQQDGKETKINMKSQKIEEKTMSNINRCSTWLPIRKMQTQSMEYHFTLRRMAYWFTEAIHMKMPSTGWLKWESQRRRLEVQVQSSADSSCPKLCLVACRWPPSWCILSQPHSRACTPLLLRIPVILDYRPILIILFNPNFSSDSISKHTCRIIDEFPLPYKLLRSHILLCGRRQ